MIRQIFGVPTVEEQGTRKRGVSKSSATLISGRKGRRKVDLIVNLHGRATKENTQELMLMEKQSNQIKKEVEVQRQPPSPPPKMKRQV